MSRLLFDARPEQMYPLGKEGFSGGSQVYIRAVTEGLAARGHEVYVITNDLEVDEKRGENLWYWPPTYFPHKVDVAIQQMHAQPNPEYSAPVLILMTSCVDPSLGPDNQWAPAIDAVPCFSEVHKKLLCQMRPIPPEKCHVTGLGVHLADYLRPASGENPWDKDCGDPTCENCRRMEHQWLDSHKVPGRLLYGNDPARGLFYVLDIFDLVKKEIPEATLHITYDFDNQMGMRAWEHSQMAEQLWDCKRRIASTPGVVNLGALTREQVIREQLECQVHCMPSDPPGIGTQTHGIMQMECAAAGCVLVLSDVEAFPEVFSEGALILPVVGRYMPNLERRWTVEDYAENVVALMRDEEKWKEASRKARALAEKNDWSQVVTKWEAMLKEALVG